MCSISYDVIQKLLIKIADYQFVTVLLSEHDQLEIEIKESINVLRNQAIMENADNLVHHRMVTRHNGLATAYILNGGIWSEHEGQYYLYHYATNYWRGALSNCRTQNQLVPAAFYLDSYRRDQSTMLVIDERIEMNSTGSVDGFFTECTPTEAILNSTLDCLYNMSCLQLLFDHFPFLDRVSVCRSSFV